MSGQKDTQAAAAPIRMASGSQRITACIRVLLESHAPGSAYTPGNTARRSPLRTSRSMVPTSLGCSRRTMTPSVARTC
jgi:hypothetical protein